MRSRIDAALREGSVTGPDGHTSHWKFLRARPGELEPVEAGHARRLIDS